MVLEFRKIFYLANHKQELSIMDMDTFYMISDFRRKDLLEIDQPQTRIGYGGHVC